MRVDLHMAIQGVQLGLQFPLGLHQSLQLLQIHVVVQNPLQQNLAAGAFLGVLRRSLLALTASERIKHLAQTPAVLAVTQDGIKVDARHRHATDQQRGRYGPDHAVQRLTELPVCIRCSASRDRPPRCGNRTPRSDHCEPRRWGWTSPTPATPFPRSPSPPAGAVQNCPPSGCPHAVYRTGRRTPLQTFVP